MNCLYFEVKGQVHRAEAYTA